MVSLTELNVIVVWRATNKYEFDCGSRICNLMNSIVVLEQLRNMVLSEGDFYEF